MVDLDLRAKETAMMEDLDHTTLRLSVLNVESEYTTKVYEKLSLAAPVWTKTNQVLYTLEF